MIYRFSSGEEFVAESPVSVYDAAAGAGIISREILCARVNGEVVDMTYVPQGDCDVKLLTFADPEDDGARRTFRHTASHILAEAVKRLYPRPLPGTAAAQRFCVGGYGPGVGQRPADHPLRAAGGDPLRRGAGTALPRVHL